MTMPYEPQYLGDGVHVEFDGYQVWVHTMNGDTKMASIALPNDGTFTNLVRYASQFYPGIIPNK